MVMAKPKLKTLRPFPPSDMGTYLSGTLSPSFVPAPQVMEWVKSQILSEGAPLYNEDHKHLEFVDLEFLWAAGGFEKQMRRVVGQAEELTFRCGPWQRGRQEQQMVEWFGRTPQYLITLDAAHCSQCSDMEFAALVEHELYHIGHKLNDFGAPAFTSDGLPKIGIRGHDVEEFVGVVRRYGVGRQDGPVARMVRAAKEPPLVGELDISRACGTCLLKVA